MELPKFVAAIGIMFLMVFFLNNFLSIIYSPPNTDYSDCYSSSAYTECRDFEFGTTEYTACYDGIAERRDQCMEDAMSGVKTYQTVYYIIMAVLAISLLLTGFFTLRFKTIGSGLIGSGVILLMFAGVFAAMSSFFGSLLSGFGGMTGLAIGDGGGTSTIGILNLVFSFIALVMTLIFSYLKLDKGSESSVSVHEEHYHQQEYVHDHGE